MIGKMHRNFGEDYLELSEELRENKFQENIIINY